MSKFIIPQILLIAALSYVMIISINDGDAQRQINSASAQNFRIHGNAPEKSSSASEEIKMSGNTNTKSEETSTPTITEPKHETQNATGTPIPPTSPETQNTTETHTSPTTSETITTPTTTAPETEAEPGTPDPKPQEETSESESIQTAGSSESNTEESHEESQDNKGQETNTESNENPSEKEPEVVAPKRKPRASSVEPNTKVTFTSSFYNESATNYEKDKRPAILCQVGVQAYCKRTFISEEVSSFWIVSPIYSANHVKTAHLYELHRNFRDYVRSHGVNFQTVEVIFPGQEFQLTKPNNEPNDLQYKDNWIFAMRENLVNVGIKHLPADWQYFSWVDQHIFWPDTYWFEKAIWLMSHHNIVHLLNGNDFWNLTNGTDYHLDGVGMMYYQYGQNAWRYEPKQYGLSWAMRREIYTEVGGLLDICIGTKCDLYQVFAYLGITYTDQTGTLDYSRQIGEWQAHAIEVYKQKIGFLDCKVYHFMHCYDDCQTSNYDKQIWTLIKNNYNPARDLHRDEEGRLSLVNNLNLAKELWVIYGGEQREQ